MTISPIQYQTYQQPNYYQAIMPQYTYQPQIAVPQQQFVPYVPPVYPNYDIYSHNINDLNKVYSPVFHPTYIDVAKEENLLYQQNNIDGLLNFGANKQMRDIYPQIKDNSDFKELLNSKYYQNGVGFINLLDTIAYVKFKKDEKLRPITIPAHVDFPYNPIDYSKYDTADYLKILNNFVKSNKISDDLKMYYLAKESKNIDNYYTKLDKIETSTNPISTLV